jgi:hypothetical protein
MKNLYTTKGKWLMASFIFLLLSIITFFSCVYLDSVEYQSTLKAGENATFTVNVRIDAAENRTARLIFSILVPKGWNAAANTTVTYTDTYDEGVVKTLSIVPVEISPKNHSGMTWDAALKEKYGVGPNVLDDMEWVTFQSDEVYEVRNGDKHTAKLTVVTKVGQENMRVKLGFFINHTDDGLGGSEDHYKVFFSDCIEIVDGDASAYVDFCELHFNSITPSNSTKDDILTIKFQGDIEPNDLDNAGEIYLIAKAITDALHEYTVSDRSVKTRMMNEQGKTYSLTFWPADYFNIPENEEILRIEYYFTNEDGSLSVMQTYDTGDPATWFLSPFMCK